jgi:hypothetical protein
MMAYLRITIVCATALLLTVHRGAVDALAAPPDDEPAANAVTIPLDQIWAVRMPGTSDLEKLAADRRSLFLSETLGVLAHAPANGQAARAGFAVFGAGFEALQQAHAILLDEQKPQRTFSAGSDVSAVFFSYQNNWYVHIHRVERRDNVVDIHYHFAWHETMDTTEHLAIIPLGKLPHGRYRVNVIQTPMERPTVSEDVARRVGDRMVSRSFSFSVSEKGD